MIALRSYRVGVSGFGVNAYTGEQPGDAVIEPHDETGMGSGHHEELYVVLAGEATFTIGEEAVAAPTGTLLFVPPGIRRQAVAAVAETTVLVVGGKGGYVGRDGRLVDEADAARRASFGSGGAES